jgi:hypothetical protein
VKYAERAATVMSQESASANPAPIAGPLIAAMVGIARSLSK